MIASQRKAHKFIWLAMVIAIPLFLIFILRDLNISTSSKDSKKEPFVAKMEGDAIQIELNQPFASPSAVVYTLTDEGKRGQSLGQLNGVGNYSFKSSENTKGILIIDEIKQEELLKIEF